MANNDEIRNAVRQIVHEELLKLKETSGTGGVAGYETPNAFSGNVKGDKKKKKSMYSRQGYSVVDNDIYGDEGELDEQLNESFYFRDEQLTPSQKVNLAIKEARLNLGRAERLVNRAMKLQQENSSDMSGNLKTVGLHLRRLNERAAQLMMILSKSK